MIERRGIHTWLDIRRLELGSVPISPPRGLGLKHAVAIVVTLIVALLVALWMCHGN
jgi:hypothetical protein